jgi:PAS domain-containing protein
MNGGNILGSYSFVSTREERNWPEELIPRLRLAGEIFANALKRKQSELELSESAERLSLATESAKMGLWVLNVNTGLVWATEKLREIFQFLPEEVLRFKRLVEVIYPDDREMVREHIDQSVGE